MDSIEKGRWFSVLCKGYDVNVGKDGRSMIFQSDDKENDGQVGWEEPGKRDSDKIKMKKKMEG